MAEVAFFKLDGSPVVRTSSGEEFTVRGGSAGGWADAWTPIGEEELKDARVLSRSEFTDIFRSALKAAGPWPGCTSSDQGGSSLASARPDRAGYGGKSD